MEFLSTSFLFITNLVQNGWITESVRAYSNRTDNLHVGPIFLSRPKKEIPVKLQNLLVNYVKWYQFPRTIQTSTKFARLYSAHCTAFYNLTCHIDTNVIVFFPAVVLDLLFANCLFDLILALLLQLVKF